MREARSRSAVSRGDSPSAASPTADPARPIRDGVGTSRSSAGDRCMSRGLGASKGDARHAVANGVRRPEPSRAVAIANGLSVGTCVATGCSAQNMHAEQHPSVSRSPVILLLPWA